MSAYLVKWHKPTHETETLILIIDKGVARLERGFSLVHVFIDPLIVSTSRVSRRSFIFPYHRKLIWWVRIQDGDWGFGYNLECKNESQVRQMEREIKALRMPPPPKGRPVML